MPDGGSLTLHSYDADRDGVPGIVIEVADTGIGIGADVVEKVFDPFFTTKRRDGTGLGLSISQTLIKRQGGQITAESQIGRGSIFRVWLPEAD
jgi:signal transduction histidine kinase